MPRRGRGSAAFLTLLVLTFAVAGCGGEDHGSIDGDGASPTVGTADVAAADVPPVSVPPAAEVPTVALDDVAVATFEMASPSWLAADDDAVYIRGDDGVVDRVDPATDEVTELARIPGGLCQGIGVGFGAVWTCAGSDVVAIDLDSGEVGEPIAVGKAAVQGHLGVGHGRVWVLVGDGSSIVGIDPESGSMDAPIELGVRGTDVGIDEDDVWVVSAADDAVVRIDPATGEVEQIVGGLGGLGGASAVAFTDGTAWVAGSGGTFPIDTGSGAVGAVVGGGAGPDGAIAALGESVWVRRADAFLREIDAASGEAVAEVVAEVTSGGDVIVAFDSVWATAYDDGVTYRLAPD